MGMESAATSTLDDAKEEQRTEAGSAAAEGTEATVNMRMQTMKKAFSAEEAGQPNPDREGRWRWTPDTDVMHPGALVVTSNWSGRPPCMAEPH